MMLALFSVISHFETLFVLDVLHYLTACVLILYLVEEARCQTGQHVVLDVNMSSAGLGMDWFYSKN